MSLSIFLLSEKLVGNICISSSGKKKSEGVIENCRKSKLKQPVNRTEGKATGSNEGSQQKKKDNQNGSEIFT